jgi:hypothetical protein
MNSAKMCSLRPLDGQDMLKGNDLINIWRLWNTKRPEWGENYNKGKQFWTFENWRSRSCCIPFRNSYW